MEQRKKQKMLMVVALAIIVVGVLVLYFGFWKKSAPSQEAAGEPQTQHQAATVIIDEKLKKIDLNTDFFVNTMLAALKSHGNLPVQKGTTGRLNPFTR